MRSDELIARVRQGAQINDVHPDYTSAWILNELNDQLMSVFEQPITEKRSGYWCKPFFTTTTANREKYRLPARSCDIETISMGSLPSPVAYSPLPELDEAHAWLAESTSVGTPLRYVIRGDQLVLLPAPDSGNYSLRVMAYLRPSRLVTQQSSTAGGGTVRGRVTAVNTTARTITVNVIPWDQDTSANIVSGTDLIDVVHPDGWHELALYDAPQTWSSLTITVGGTYDMSEIAVGDFVRKADQTDWPALPDDFHRCLADCAAVKILTERGFAQQAALLAGSVSPDIGRFNSMLSRRVATEPRTLRAPLPYLRGAQARRGLW